MAVLTLRETFDRHRCGDVLTRRMVVHVADDMAMAPREAVAAMEREGLAKRGSWEWFVANGGITSAHINQARAERSAPTKRGRDDG